MATATSAATLCRNYINGKWVESRSTKIVERRNPANTDEVVARIPLSTREEMKEAIAAAKAAFPAWRETPAPNRGRILFNATRLMQEQKEELARLLTREERKALKDSLGEVQRAINITEFMAGEARRLNGETLTSELPKNFSYTIRQPLGVVGAITPWNFPVAIPVWKIAPALVCGNTVVFKPATLTPLTAMKIAEIFEQAGLPPGALNLVMGSGRDTGDELVQNPLVHGLSFTGSNEVGCALHACRRVRFHGTALHRHQPRSDRRKSRGSVCVISRRAREKICRRRRPRIRRRYGALGGRKSDEHGPEVHRDRQKRRKAA